MAHACKDAVAPRGIERRPAPARGSTRRPWSLRTERGCHGSASRNHASRRDEVSRVVSAVSSAFSNKRADIFSSSDSQTKTRIRAHPICPGRAHTLHHTVYRRPARSPQLHARARRVLNNGGSDRRKQHPVLRGATHNQSCLSLMPYSVHTYHDVLMDVLERVSRSFRRRPDHVSDAASIDPAAMLRRTPGWMSLLVAMVPTTVAGSCAVSRPQEKSSSLPVVSVTRPPAS